MDTVASHRWRNIIAMVTLVSSAVFATLNYLNSRATNEQINWVTEQMKVMSKEKEMTRQMLDSRAEIQMILIQAASDGRALTPAEVITINRLYVPAEYPYRQK